MNTSQVGHRLTRRGTASAVRTSRILRVAAIGLQLVASVSSWVHAEPAPPRAETTDVVVDAQTESVIKGALRFLASKQSAEGYWRSSSNNHHAAITAYVLICFMSAGNLPHEGEHAAVVKRGTEFLLSCVRPDGYIAHSAGESNMYGHGIATVALAELYGQTRDPSLRPKLQKAANLIVQCQNDEGGWRYQPRIADADISVTVVQLVALRAAKNGGLDVPQETIDRAVRYIKSCCDPRTGGFRYMPRERRAGFARTAAAIYSLQVCGRYDDEMIKPASEFLFDRFLKGGDEAFGGEWFTYGNFYAAPAQYMIGGETWSRWYGRVKPTLLANVRRQGELCSWQPLDRERGVNDVFATAIYATVLAVPWGYLPLYQR